MSKLLFITQKIDRNDDVLGVYHRWAEELGKKTDKLNIICLYKGENNLDKNIGVFSLGKENGVSRLRYIYRFYKYIFSIRKDYDSVLVHMNPIYIVLGGFFWKLTGKKIFLWYNHPMGNITARIGSLFSNKIFCTSSQSFFAKNKKAQLMPVGIDIEIFKKKPEISRKENRILCLGRISPIKKVEHIIEVVKILNKKKFDLELLIVGSPTSSSDKIYYNNLVKLSGDLVNAGKIIFKSSVPNYKTPDIYNSASLYVNLTKSGSLDKAILEAMACQLPVVVTNSDFISILGEDLGREFVYRDNDLHDLSDKIFNFFSKDFNERDRIGKEMRNIVVKNHSLEKLVNKLSDFISI